MAYKPEGYYTIKGRLTWAQLNPILGASVYGLQRDTKSMMPEEGEPCGLSSSREGLTYKIYSIWKDSIGSCAAHVVLHPDGVCFSGALQVEQDWDFAKELFLKVKTVLDKYR